MKNILLISVLFFLSACTKYEVRYEGATALDAPLNDISLAQPIVYAEDNSISLTNTYFDKFKTLVNTSGLIVGMAMNDAKNRIAYRTSGGNIRVVDLEGNQIKEISNTSDIVAFEYYHNGTLYMCSASGVVTFDGEALPIKSTNLKTYLNDLDRVLGMAILNNHDVYCIYEATNNSARVGYATPSDLTQNESFPYGISDVFFIRAYNYWQESTAYKLHIKLSSGTVGIATVESSKYFYETGIKGFKVQDDDIQLNKRFDNGYRISYKQGQYFKFSTGALERFWPNFASNKEIRFLDF